MIGDDIDTRWMDEMLEWLHRRRHLRLIVGDAQDDGRPYQPPLLALIPSGGNEGE